MGKKSVGPLECLPSEDKNLSGNFIGKLIHFRIIIYASSFSRAFFYIKIPIFFFSFILFKFQCMISFRLNNQLIGPMQVQPMLPVKKQP